MANDPSNSFTHEGQLYTSAYEAVVERDPASNPIKNFNAYVNSFIVPHSVSIQIIKSFGAFWGHYVTCYLRNFFAGCIVYYGTAGFFHYHCYIHPRSKEIFKDRKSPSNAIIFDQIKLAQASLFIYVLLPAISEFVIEEGYTKCYYTIEEIGGFIPYLLNTIVYFALVEIGIYWVSHHS
jgi:lathosterol oxidase